MGLFIHYFNQPYLYRSLNILRKGEAGMSENKRRQFAKQHFLSWLRLREWKQTHQQLVELAEGL
ncbi:hypothetical protein EA710_20055, partial [Acinetobacter baumannii]